MPTKEKQRQRRLQKRTQRRQAIKLHSALSIGHSLPVPVPPDFGPAKFTEAEQAANPDKPLTRVIKDVLRIGQWKEGFDEAGKVILGQYTAEELAIIFNNSTALMENGDAINFGKSHGDEQMIIPTDELISPVDEIRLDNGVIWASTYVTPEQAKYLSNPAMKVSAGMVRKYTAGNGKEFNGRTMLQIAVTDRPVVGGQGPFRIALSNYIALGTWSEAQAKKAAADQKPAEVKPVAPAKKTPVPVRRVAKAAKPIRKPIRRVARKLPRRKAAVRLSNEVRGALIAFANLEGGGSVDPTILEAINLLLSKLGVDAIPDGTPPEEIGPMLKGIAMGLGMAAEEEEEVEETEEVVDDAAALAAAGGTPVMMANLIPQIDARIQASTKPILEAVSKLSDAVAGKTKTEADDKKSRYMTFRNALGKGDANGLAVSEAVLAEKDKLAERLDWDTGVLEGLHPTIKLSNLVSQQGATAERQETKKSDVLTDAEVEARIKAKGGNPANMPKAGI